jgi:PAS domain S-box-containing protein
MTGHGQWVDSWRAAVRASRSAVGLAELPSTRFVELSAAAATLLGTTPSDGIGLHYLGIVDRPDEVAASVGLLTTGALDAVDAQRRFRRRDGSSIDLRTCGRAIRSRSGNDLVLWLAGDAVTEPLANATHSVDGLVMERQWSVVTLDGRWRVERLDTDDDRLLGHRPAELIGAELISLIHPDDIAALLLAFARATTTTTARERLRFRHRDGTWRSVHVVARAEQSESQPPLALALAPESQPVADGDRVRELEAVLRRVVRELEAAGVVARTSDAGSTLNQPAIEGLSPRQQEVLSRLLRGERVPRIASAMYLSQSTVRNHLAAIFRRVGVHSQEALLAELRRRTPASRLGL